MSKNPETDPNDFNERDNSHAKHESKQSTNVRKECNPSHASFEKYC